MAVILVGAMVDRVAGARVGHDFAVLAGTAAAAIIGAVAARIAPTWAGGLAMVAGCLAVGFNLATFVLTTGPGQPPFLTYSLVLACGATIGFVIVRLVRSRGAKSSRPT